MKTTPLLLLFLIFMLCADLLSVSASEENKGAGNMVLTGGQRWEAALPLTRKKSQYHVT